MADYKVKYEIDADAGKAKAELKDVDKLINAVGGGATGKLQRDFKAASSEISNLTGIFTGNRLTGATSQITSFGNAVGALPGPIGLATGLIAGMATAAAGLGVAFFEAEKHAAEFGSIIHDAAQKTGLSATAISALKFNAENAGSSLESVTSGLAKFSKVVGAAADGSQKAKDQLVALGVDPKKAISDLDGALDTVFKRIANAKPGIEQTTLAQKAFGKAGADLIPVILQMEGQFTRSVEAAKALGVTLSDQDAKAADDFGDTLGLLGTQATVMADKFLLLVAPDVTAAMKSISQEFAANQDTIRAWAIAFKVTFEAVINAAKLGAHTVQTQFDLINSAISLSSNHIINDLGEAWNIVTLGAHRYAIEAFKAARAAGGARGEAGFGTTGGGSGTGASNVSRGSGLDIEDITGGKASRGGRSANDDAKRIAERDLAAQIALEKKNLETIRKNLKEDFDKIRETFATDGDTDAFLKAGTEGMQRYAVALQDSLSFLDALENRTRAGKTEHEKALLTAEQLERRDQQVQLGKDENAKNNKALAEDAEKRVKRDIDNAGKLLDKDKERLETIKKQNDEFLKQINLIGSMVPPGYDAAGNTTAQVPGGESSTGNPFLDALFGSQGMDIFQTNAQIMGGVITELGQTVGDVFAQMSQALGQGISDWVLYGGSIGEALKKATAAVLAQIAAQAAVKAIYYTAEGIAALFYNPAAAAGFFTAAAIFGSIAVGSALLGRAVAGNSFNGKGAKGASTGSTSSSNVNQNPTPISRASQNAFESARQQSDPAVEALARAVDKLHNKIAAMNPGDVLTAGAQQRKGFIGRQTVEDIRSNSGIGTNLMRATGNR